MTLSICAEKILDGLPKVGKSIFLLTATWLKAKTTEIIIGLQTGGRCSNWPDEDMKEAMQPGGKSHQLDGAGGCTNGWCVM